MNVLKKLMMVKNTTECEVVVSEVVKAVSMCYGEDERGLYSSTRKIESVECRWMAWVFIRLYLPDVPMKRLATEFGLSDHTTVINGLRQMRYRIKASKEYGAMYNRLRGMINVELPGIKRHELDWGVIEWRQRALMLENELKKYKN